MGDKDIFAPKRLKGDGKTSECKFNEEGRNDVGGRYASAHPAKVFDEDLLVDDELITWKTAPSDA